MKKACKLIIFLIMCCGCASGGVNQPKIPEVNLDTNFTESQSKTERIALESIYNNQDFKLLQKQALIQNEDIKIAISNIQAARQTLNKTTLYFLPEISINGSRLHKGDMNGGVNTHDNTETEFSAEAGLELDVFGRGEMAKQIAATGLNLQKTLHDQVKLEVSTEVARLYTQIASTKQQIAIQKQIISSFKEVLGMSQYAHKIGLISMTNLDKASNEYLTADKNMSELESRHKILLKELSNISGVKYDKISNIQYELPTDNNKIYRLKDYNLANLRSIYNVVLAENNYLTSFYSLELQKKDLLPTISISGSISSSTNILGTSIPWIIFPSVSYPLFKKNLITSEINRQQSLLEASKDQYIKTIKSSILAIESSFISYNTAIKSFNDSNKQYSHSTSIFNRLKDEHKQGNMSKLDFEKAKIDFLNSEMMQISAHASLKLSLLAVYKNTNGYISNKG